MAMLRRTRLLSMACRFRSTCSMPTELPSMHSSTASRTLRKETNPEKIADVFANASRSGRFHYDKSIYEHSVRKLAKCERFDLIEKLLEQQKLTPWIKEEGFLIRIMKLYSSAKMVDQAICTFDQMEELGVGRTSRSICALLTVYLENGQYDQVHKIFAEIPEKFGISRDIVSYNIVIKAFVNQKSLNSAYSVIQEMKKHGITPNLVSYNTLLSGSLSEGDQVRVDEILKEMEEQGIRPDVITYSSRIVACRRNNEISKARELFDEMVSKGIEPNVISLNNLIEGFCIEGDLESAKKMLENAVSKNYPVNSSSYFTMINRAIDREDFELAFEICKQSIGRKWVPPVTTLESLSNGLKKISKTNESEFIAKAMMKKINPNSAKKLLEVEDSGNLGLRSTAFFSVINDAIGREDFDVALELCKKSIEKQWVPPLSTMESLVIGLKKLSRVEDAKFIVEEMQKTVSQLSPA